MEDIQTIAVIIYLAGIIGCAFAGDKRTIGGFGGVLLGLFCTPLVGAVLLLAWPEKR